MGERLVGYARLAVIIGALVLLLALVGGRCFGGLCIPDVIGTMGAALRGTTEGVEVEAECPRFEAVFSQLLPREWTVRHVRSISIDDDEEKECLVIYQYDAGGGAYGGPLGGVIYDPQPGLKPGSAATLAPFRPASYIPYHLLPRENGKGFLSERAVDWSRMIQVYDADGDKSAELVIQGFSGYNSPTYLTIFRWQDKAQGYRLLTRQPANDPIGGPLWGDAGIVIKRAKRKDAEGNEISGPIEQVVTKHRPAAPFWYFRSQFCYAQVYAWNETKTLLQRDDYYLTFCFGRPRDAKPGQPDYAVWYPEQALLAWYRDGKVREIDIPAQPVGNTLRATVTLTDGNQERWLLTRTVKPGALSEVKSAARWHLQRIGQTSGP